MRKIRKVYLAGQVTLFPALPDEVEGNPHENAVIKDFFKTLQ